MHDVGELATAPCPMSSVQSWAESPSHDLQAFLMAGGLRMVCGAGGMLAG